MFTGIVTDMGTVRRARRRGGPLQLEIEAPTTARELKRGDSVAVNGTCLTATGTGRKRFLAEVVEETVALTTLGELSRGARVNLELAARPTDRLGGHFVQGHIDGTARLVRLEKEDGSRRMWWEAGDDILDYIVGKGSVALDGVSLTVVDVGRATFQVAIIPHTLETTVLGDLQVGDRANVEVDLIAKYVEKLIPRRHG
jgi:riboflavin synthase